MQVRGKNAHKTIRSLKSRVLTRLAYFNALRDCVLTHVTRCSHSVLYTAHTGRMFFMHASYTIFGFCALIFVSIPLKRIFITICLHSFNGFYFVNFTLSSKCKQNINSSIITEALF